MQNPQYVKRAADALKESMPAIFLDKPPVGLITGTGLGDIAAGLPEHPAVVKFADIPNFPLPSTESHAGEFISGMVCGQPVIIQNGRCHLYEGHSPAEVCMGARVMGLLGARVLIVTNAAGSLNPLFPQGSLMLMADQINHTGVSPLTGQDAFGPRFPDMSAPFAPRLRAIARRCALDLDLTLHEGIYIGVHGPEMETPAETRMYRRWGADAVGMSTVLEVIAARQMSIECIGISCLTNQNLPDCMAPAPIEAVAAAATEAAPRLLRLVKAILLKIAPR